ncbi:hypothetical protein DENSPDRAFT_780878 [Dentipellis sp. KUC8613]|nr:hypothetical protein DENSPDRAFT_780878 [Dentipellis sp. KUC8613]
MVVDGALTLPVPVLGETQAPPLPPPPPVKPKLPVRPPIWAQSRQEVCESLDSFRSYQGGVYSAQDVARGYLLSAFAASRDIFAHGGRLIISHGGGKAEALHSKSGQLHRQRAANQLADDKSVRALLKNHQIGEPLVLLADDRYALFPYDLATPGYTYVVLGRYRIVHAWAEYQPNGAEAARVIRYKFAFEWCAEQGAPWWCPEEPQLCPQSPATLLEPPVPDVARSQCAICSKTSPLVYEQGWMCLHPECAAFWSIDGAEPASDSLTYDPAFIYARNQDAERDPALDVEKPEAPDPRGGSVTSRQFTRGIHCRVCGRLSCRWRWDGWECSSCGIRHEALGVIRSHKDFWAQQTQLGIYHHKVAPGSGILVGRTMTRYNRDGSQQASYQTFTFPEGRGKIHHIQGSQLVNKEANEIFKEYQEQAKNGQLLFRRFPLRNVSRGELLTNYFSQNTDHEYLQYVGGADRTEPLETGPPAVLRALRLVGRRVKQLLGLDAHFNEVLSAAYMEQQRMAFHSDAERGLGEVVAGLSLGSTALMHFRLHSQFVPHNDKKTNRNTVLTVALRHGDILVMEGHDVQKYYEHTVVPVNFRIAATARSISPENYQSH